MDNILMLDRKVLRFVVYVRGADSSHELLLRKYKEIIHQRHLADPKTFSFVRFYDECDEGRELKRLINDCESGKVDIILTGSVINFCRKKQDTIDIARRLKELPNPVGIWFDRDGLFTLDGITVVAEEESVRMMKKGM